MQKILSFNTIFNGVNIILQNTSEIITTKNFESKKQSEILVKSLEDVLKEYSLNYFDIDIFSTITGPGNFTGIKTSLAVLKALQISTKKEIITTDVFEILSYNAKNDYDFVIVDMETVKLYIKTKDNIYSTIYKKDIQHFLNQNNNAKILTNSYDIVENSTNIDYSKYTDEKWAELVKFKAKNGMFANTIEPLYIEEAMITKRKN